MIDMSAGAVTERLRRVARETSLRAERRLDPKLDMSPAGITRRLEKVEALRRLCLALVQVGERAGLGRRRRDEAQGPRPTGQ